MSSSLSSNENSGASDSLARASYYASTQQQQQHIHYQQQQIYGNNPHLIHHQQQQQHQQINYSQRSYPQQQHPQLSQIFPSIYSDSSSSGYMSGAAGNGLGAGHQSASAGGSTLSSATGAAVAASSHHHVSSVQRQIQQDWSNREDIEVILSNIKKITDFLNTFDLSCRSKLALLDEKLTKLEREIDFVEARVTKGQTLN